MRTATSGGRNETGREGLRSSSSNEDKRPPAPFRDALTYVSMDLGRVSPLNPHPSARENTARLMICPTRGEGGREGGGGWPSLASRAAEAAAAAATKEEEEEEEETPTAAE